jgi:hypothetical protein
MPERMPCEVPIGHCLHSPGTGEGRPTTVPCDAQIITLIGAPLSRSNPNAVEDKGMQNSLSWIEWLDRLDRVLKGARQDVKALARFSNPHAVAAIERCKRQLCALTNDLRLLDRSVLSPRPGSTNSDRADNLQKALDTAVFRLDTVAQHSQAVANSPLASPAARERMLAAVDSALRDSCYEAAKLVCPDRRTA